MRKLPCQPWLKQRIKLILFITQPLVTSQHCRLYGSCLKFVEFTSQAKEAVVLFFCCFNEKNFLEFNLEA